MNLKSKIVNEKINQMENYLKDIFKMFEIEDQERKDISEKRTLQSRGGKMLNCIKIIGRGKNRFKTFFENQNMIRNKIICNVQILKMDKTSK